MSWHTREKQRGSRLIGVALLVAVACGLAYTSSQAADLCPDDDVCFISRVYLPMISDGIELSSVGPVVVVGDGPDVPPPTVMP